MKKLFAIFLTLILACSNFNVVSAQDQTEIQKWEQELSQIQKEIEVSKILRNTQTFEEKRNQMNRLGDIIYNLNVAKWNVVDIENIYTEDTKPLYEARIKALTVYNGDIILIKPKKWEVFWAPFVGWVSHAAIIVNKNQVAEIKDNKSVSTIRNFSDFMNDHKDSADQIMVINMGLSTQEWNTLSNYVTGNLLGKPYPAWHEFHRSKEWMHKFYCSSLVWRAHFSSGRFLDLDDNDKRIIFPVELAFSKNTGKINVIQH